jgi:hypothetical protein
MIKRPVVESRIGTQEGWICKGRPILQKRPLTAKPLNNRFNHGSKIEPLRVPKHRYK